MFIVNGGETKIINSEFVERFEVFPKSDACLIAAIYNDVRPFVTIGRYKDKAEAQGAVRDLLSALSTKQDVFYMPESVLFAQEPYVKDARVKRKGGS